VLSHPPPSISFDGVRHRCRPALGVSSRHELIEKLHHLVGQTDCDLRGHPKMVPVRDDSYASTQQRYARFRAK
jgi:hypothetical protein